MEFIAYEETTETSSGHPPIRPNKEYAKSVNGLFKIAEIVLCFIILICSSIDWYDPATSWMEFVSCSAMITTIILFLFYFLNIVPRLPGIWYIIVLIYYCVYDVLFVIAAIVAAVRAHHSDAIAAAAFFTFAALIVYAIDTYFMYQDWQTGKIPVAVDVPVAVAVPVALTTTTYSTTTTVGNIETKVQY